MKISGDGWNVISVPVSESEVPIISRLCSVFPFLKVAEYSFPFLQIVNFKYYDNALTTDTPTPCKPPETL